MIEWAPPVSLEEIPSPMKQILILLSLMGAFYSYSFSQTPLFESDSVLKLKIEGDLFACINDRGDVRDYHDVRVVHYLADGDSVVLPMLARVRGNFRRKKSTCPFPPLRLKMKDSVVVGTVFEGQKKIKLVTHCRGKNQNYEQKLFQEFLVYRSYNILTEESFRVRMMEITYVNTGKKPYVREHHGFLIEDDDDVAGRMGGVKMESGNVHPMRTDPLTSNRVALFQFMIGNTDWSIPAGHNVELIIPAPGAAPKVVPYDFDWSGLVSAPYAEPNPMLGLSNVKERLYRGFCRDEESWQNTLDLFQEKKPEILGLYESFPYLTTPERNGSMRYLNEFFDIIEDPRRRRITIEDKCRTNR